MRVTCLRRLVGMGILAVGLFVTTLARSDDDQAIAGQLFQAGLAAYERGDFKAAARAFTEANGRAPRGATLFNAGLAWEAAGERTRAADAYGAAIATRELPLTDAGTAARQLEALER